MFSQDTAKWILDNSHNLEYGVAGLAIVLLIASVIIIKKGI